MQSALRPPRWSLGGWVTRNPGIAAGGFLSGIFLLVGLIGTLVFQSQLRDWFAAGSWPTTKAVITASQVQFGGGRNRGARPDFTFRYYWQGRTYVAQGYDLIGAFTRGTSGGAGTVLQVYPVGTRVTVLVNPERPEQAVLIRGSVGGVIVLFVPPVFFLLGSVGMFFTIITKLGWLEENTRNPLGLAIRVTGSWFLQEKVLKPFFFVVVGSVILGIGGLGVQDDNMLLVLFAGVMAWGVWRAARPQRGGRVQDDSGEDD